MGSLSWLSRVRIVDLMSERLTRPVRFGVWNLGVSQLGLYHSVAAAGL